ncbi:hypothetical protein AB4Z21_17145 [Paenibacillus sp. MCAF20]
MAKSIMDKVEDVLEKLATLQGGTDDRYNSTKGILESFAQFADKGLDEVIVALEEIRDEVEEAEDRIEELESQVEELNQ